MYVVVIQLIMKLCIYVFLYYFSEEKSCFDAGK